MADNEEIDDDALEGSAFDHIMHLLDEDEDDSDEESDTN